MRLSQILEGCEINTSYEDTEITGIASDSRAVKEGNLFICVKGGRFDGHDFAAEAIQKGASVILAEKIPEGTDAEKVILAGDTRLAESLAWYNFYGKPAERMTKIAVTGTAGKTSTVFIMRHILSAVGRRVGIITTIRAMSGERILPLGEHGGSSVVDLYGAMTTPDPEFFWYAVSEMQKDGCDTLIYEASSQSILRKNTAAIVPDIAVYTNLSEEHLDAHGTMENYFAAKAELLRGVKKAVINIDDEWFKALPQMYPDCDFVKISAHPGKVGECDVCALRYRSHGEDGIEYVYFSDKAVFRVMSPQIGFYSVYNTIEAAACALSLGADPMTVQEALADMDGIDGRMYRIQCRYTMDVSKNKKIRELPGVFIDYAHTPRALSSACKALYSIKKEKSKAGSRLIVLFGCGGDRDKNKRPMMAKAAQEYADFTIITGDNPRSEDPADIIDDILSGIDKTKPYIVIPDRRAAIKYAVTASGGGDIILLAGKGHEKYEITRDGMKPFDEEQIVRDAFSEKIQNNIK